MKDKLIAIWRIIFASRFLVVTDNKDDLRAIFDNFKVNDAQGTCRWLTEVANNTISEEMALLEVKKIISK